MWFAILLWTTSRQIFTMDGVINDLTLRFAQMTQQGRVKCIEQIAAGYYAPVAEYKIARELEGSRSRQSTVSKEARNQEEDQRFIQRLCELSSEYGLEETLMKTIYERSTTGLLHDEHPWSGPLLFLPCANVDLRFEKKCPNPGSQACTGCRLVSYCSTVRPTPHPSDLIQTLTFLSGVSECPLASSQERYPSNCPSIPGHMS
jgi:hypothetical protein